MCINGEDEDDDGAYEGNRDCAIILAMARMMLALVMLRATVMQRVWISQYQIGDGHVLVDDDDHGHRDGTEEGHVDRIIATTAMTAVLMMVINMATAMVRATVTTLTLS